MVKFKMMECADINNLTRDDLYREYQELLKKYEEMRLVTVRDSQNINDLSKALGTAKSTELHILKETEEYWEKDFNHTLYEVDDMRKRCNRLELSYEKLQHECKDLITQNQQLSKELNENVTRCHNSIVKENYKGTKNTKLTESILDRLQMLETRKDELLCKLKEYEECSTRCTILIAGFEKNKEILKDQVNGLEMDLKHNREDLNEKMQILDSIQEQLVEANMKIASLAGNENHDLEGKSLFAEVDDKRQAIKQLLVEQKKTYLEMRKTFLLNEREIRNLKRENTSMLKELKTCRTLFCSADKFFEERLYKRKNRLVEYNEQLEKKLFWMQGCLRDVSADNGAIQPDLILSLCKKEKDGLKQQLHSAGIQNAALEEQIRDALQDFVRWRFESLKLRCVLADRDKLLESL